MHFNNWLGYPTFTANRCLETGCFLNSHGHFSIYLSSQCPRDINMERSYLIDLALPLHRTGGRGGGTEESAIQNFADRMQ